MATSHREFEDFLYDNNSSTNDDDFLCIRLLVRHLIGKSIYLNQSISARPMLLSMLIKYFLYVSWIILKFFMMTAEASNEKYFPKFHDVGDGIAHIKSHTMRETH